MIIIVDKILARFLYAKDFYVAWRYVPWLTIALVFSALSEYLGGFFTAAKQTKMFTQSSVFGAVINIVLNLVFTPIVGVMGATVATSVSYFVMWLLRLIQSKKYVNLKVHFVRDVVSYLALIVQSIILLIVENIVVMYCVEVVLFIFVLFLYISDMKKIGDKALGALKGSKMKK